MKISLSLIPDFPPSRCVEIAVAAEKHGIHGIWFADEIWHRDGWIVMGLCASSTKLIRIGPGVTHPIFREPAFTAQALATLEQIAPGRVFCGFSIGNPSMLEQFHIPLKGSRLFERMEEGVEVMRRLWRGRLDYNGKFKEYTGITTTAIPTSKIPIYIGGMAGPRSFEFAGRIGDSVTSACGNTEEYHRYVLSIVKEAARKAGKDSSKMQYSAWDPFCVSKDAEAAKRAAKALVGPYIPCMVDKQIELQGIDTRETRPIKEAFARGDINKAAELTSIELVEKLSISGSPEECIKKLEVFQRAGVDEVYLGIAEPELLKALTGVSASGVPGYPELFEIIRKEILPHFHRD